MNIIDFVNNTSLFLVETSADASTVCGSIMKALYIVGLVVLIIKIFVPLALIVIGMIKLTKAITTKDEANVKEAQSDLIKRLIYGVVIFLIPTIVYVVMNTFGVIEEDSKSCWKCVLNSQCEVDGTEINLSTLIQDDFWTTD